MKKMIIWNILISLITMGVIFFYVYDIIGNDFINIISLAIAGLILALTTGSTLRYFYQIKNEKASGELFPYSWDNIREYDNNIPTGWAVSFILSIVFVMYYILVAYPTWSFSQIGQYNEEVIAHNKYYEEKHKAIANDKNELSKMGESLFLVQCSICHGVLADGLNGKATDLSFWSSEQNIINVIKDGSKGSHYAIEMPAGLVNEKNAKAIASYVSKKFFSSQTTSHPELVSSGKKKYETSCASCHGMDGNGVVGLAPSLTSLVSSVLNTGRNGDIGAMPKFDSLSEIEKKALNAYIYNLNQ